MWRNSPRAFAVSSAAQRPNYVRVLGVAISALPATARGPALVIRTW